MRQGDTEASTLQFQRHGRDALSSVRLPNRNETQMRLSCPAELSHEPSRKGKQIKEQDRGGAPAPVPLLQHADWWWERERMLAAGNPMGPSSLSLSRGAPIFSLARVTPHSPHSSLATRVGQQHRATRVLISGALSAFQFEPKV